MGQLSSTLYSIKHDLYWKTSRGFRPQSEFVSVQIEDEFQASVVMLSAREGHNKMQLLMEKMLATFGIPYDSVDKHPIKVWIARDVPDPERTGYLKEDRRELIAPSAQELEYFINDGRWKFYFEILSMEMRVGTVKYPEFQKPLPFQY